MICTCCARESEHVVVGSGACPECDSLAHAMQDLWTALPLDERPAGLASAVGHIMRVTIERNVPNDRSVPNGWGWRCEDCAFATANEQAALDHSDEHKHSLGRAPLS